MTDRNSVRNDGTIVAWRIQSATAKGNGFEVTRRNTRKEKENGFVVSRLFVKLKNMYSRFHIGGGADPMLWALL